MSKKSGGKTLMDRFTGISEKMSEPLAKFANTAVISSIVSGLIATMPIIMIGAIFLIFYVLGSPSVGTSGHALIPFLTPIATKFAWMNNVTLGLMALYCSISISTSYAEKLHVDTKSAGLLGIATFIIFTIGGPDKAGGFNVVAFSASGLFVSMITSILSVKLYKYLVDKNITIKMPSSVPPNIGSAFTSMIPYAVCFTLAWIVRVLLNFDMVKWLNTILKPVLSGSDNIFVAALCAFIPLILWSIGLHGDNMFLTLFTPFGMMWLNQNTNALSNGVSIYQLPHVLAGVGQTGLLRLTVWTAAIWPLIALMLISKVKFLKTLGWTSLVPGIFTIVEPVIFGLPVVLNPFLIIPFILSGTVSTMVGYLLMSTDFFGKFYAMVPWATPPFILGPLGTGDWKTLFIPIIAFFIGLILYLPFWRTFEASLLKKEQANHEEQ